MELGAVSDLVEFNASAFSTLPPRPAAPSLPFPALRIRVLELCVSCRAWHLWDGGSTGLAQGHLPLPQRGFLRSRPSLHSQGTIRAQTPPMDQLRPPGPSSRGSPTILLTQVIATDHSRPQAAGCPRTLSKSCWLHVQNVPIFHPAPTSTSASLV